MDRNLFGGMVFSTAALFIVGPANAKDMGWYIGAGVGQANYDSISESEANAIFAADGITATTSIDDSDMGWKLFGGYQVNPNFALELGYVDLGEISMDVTVTAPVAGTASAGIEIDGFALSGLGILPIGDRFGVFGRVGLYAWDGNADMDVTISGVGTVSLSEDADGTDIFFGLGAKYDFTDNLGARVEWERYDIDGDDVDLISGSLVFSF